MPMKIAPAPSALAFNIEIYVFECIWKFALAPSALAFQMYFQVWYIARECNFAGASVVLDDGRASASVVRDHRFWVTVHPWWLTNWSNSFAEFQARSFKVFSERLKMFCPVLFVVRLLQWFTTYCTFIQ